MFYQFIYKFIKNIYLRLLILFYDEKYYDDLIKNSNFFLDHVFYIKYLIKNDQDNKIEEHINKILKKNNNIDNDIFIMLLLMFHQNINIKYVKMFKNISNCHLIYEKLLNYHLEYYNDNKANKYVRLLEQGKHYYSIASQYYSNSFFNEATKYYDLDCKNSYVNSPSKIYLSHIYLNNIENIDKILNLIKYRYFDPFYFLVRYDYYYIFAKIYEKKNEINKAEKYYLKLDTCFNIKRHIHIQNIAEFYERHGNYEKAIFYLKLLDNNFNCFLKLAKIYQYLNYINDAEKYYILALNFKNEYDFIFSSIYQFYINIDKKKAFNIYKLAIKNKYYSIYNDVINNMNINDNIKKRYYILGINKKFKSHNLKNYYLNYYCLNYSLKKYKKKYFSKLSFKINKQYEITYLNYYYKSYIFLYHKNFNIFLDRKSLINIVIKKMK